MKQWSLVPGKGIQSLQLIETEQPQPSVGELRIKIMATSINARDLMIASGHYPAPTAEQLIPLSDGAGIVTAIGEGIEGFNINDRVVIPFNPAYLDGRREPWMFLHALGALDNGVLAEEIVQKATAVVKLPDNISFETAACFPCAGVTAWNALFESGRLLLGDNVLIIGTGGVSLIALQLAKAAGANVIITSSSDSRLEKARALGADAAIDYIKNPEWQDKVKEFTSGLGANMVIESAGPPTIEKSIKATAVGGRVAQIGFKGMEGKVSPLDLVMGGVIIVPIQVGSRRFLERLVRAYSVNNLEAPIGQKFSFGNAPEAFAALEQGEAFGKIVINGFA